MSKKTIIAASAAALLAVAGAGGYFYMAGKGMLGEGGAAGQAPEPESVGVITMEPFLTNVADGSGRRHARVEIKLAVSPEERANEVAADKLAMARLRDQVLTLITSKSIEELTSPEGKAALRQQIQQRAAPIVAPGSVKEALFGELIVQ